jgi:hypothetical protein
MPPLLAASLYSAPGVAEFGRAISTALDLRLVAAPYCRGVRTLAGGAGSKLLRNGLISMPPRRMKRA